MNNNRNKILIDRKIRRILRRTDWIVINAENVFNNEEVQCTKDYRQAIRDMDKNNYVFPDLPACVNPLDLEE